MTAKKQSLFIIILVGLMLISFYFYSSMLKASMSSVAIILKNSYSINEFELSLLSSVFYMVAGILKVPMGILIDRYGAKRILLLVVLFTSIGSILFAYSECFYGFLIARIFMSISYASALLCAVKVISQYFPVRLYAFLVGFVLFTGYLGASFAGGPLSSLINSYGIEATYSIIGIVGIFIMLVLAVKMENSDAKNHTTTLKEFLKSSFNIIKNRQVVYLALYTGLIVAGPICMADLWGKLYLVEIYGVSKINAGFIATTAIYLGISVGSLIWGVLHSVFVFDKKTLIFISILMAISIVIFFIIPQFSLLFAIIVGFLIGMFSAVKVVCYELVKRYVSYQNLALVVALLAMSVTFGSFIIQTIVGLIQYIAACFTDDLFISYTAAIAILPLLIFITVILASKIVSLEKH